MLFGVYPATRAARARSHRRAEGRSRCSASIIRNNVAVAIDTLRANKLRSGLTILGVVIGVSTVMTMAAIVQGIKDQIVRTIEIAGPTTFYVMKVFSQHAGEPGPASDMDPNSSRSRGGRSEADRGCCPRSQYAGDLGADAGAARVQGRAHAEPASSTAPTTGSWRSRAASWSSGRWFTKAEMASGAPVVVRRGGRGAEDFRTREIRSTSRSTLAGGR